MTLKGHFEINWPGCEEPTKMGIVLGHSNVDFKSYKGTCSEDRAHRMNIVTYNDINHDTLVQGTAAVSDSAKSNEISNQKQKNVSK